MRLVTPPLRALIFLSVVWLAPTGAAASSLNVSPEAAAAIRLMYSGQLEEAIVAAREIEAARPDHPLGYLIEADALWWKIYCRWEERKYNTIDSWSHSRPGDADDNAELALADKAAQLAERAIARSDTAQMEFYAGMGYASRARLVGLRYERLATARAGVEARKHLLRCIELDPNLADAYLGLGLYNYYADTLSAMAKILRFFMGIPGGDKRVGLRQLETAATKGELTQMEARFQMAKNLRNYDRDYARAAEAAAPLIAQYPQNPIFLLLAGDIAAKLGHNDEAAKQFHAAGAASGDKSACSEHARQLAREARAALGAPDRK